LRGVPFLSPLSSPTLEQLASGLLSVHLDAGQQAFRQGERGDRFFLVEKGEVELESDGRRIATFGPGYYFGEIALLHDVARTATVRAVSDVDLYALERDEFVAAVTGHASRPGRGGRGRRPASAGAAGVDGVAVVDRRADRGGARQAVGGTPGGGAVVNIHTNGPEVSAHGIYTLSQASAGTYIVLLNVFSTWGSQPQPWRMRRPVTGCSSA
jgi:Cyclic nucleotide-binding domain